MKFQVQMLQVELRQKGVNQENSTKDNATRQMCVPEIHVETEDRFHFLAKMNTDHSDIRCDDWERASHGQKSN